jgi:excisionase family DNA binding protein
MMVSEWLSLSEAAGLLGVHPSTVRSWADHGRLPAHRTEGGHRRFRRTDVELWLHSQKDNQVPVDLMLQHALRRTRLEISEGKLEEADWYRKLDADSRNQYRLSGRSLLLGLIGHFSDGPIESASAEARSLGYEYASRGQRCGLTNVEAVSAFLYFRELLMTSMVSYYEEAGITSPKAWSEMVCKSQAFTDEILITLLSTYEAYQRNGK